jgi:hypothetical protein
MKGAGRWCGYRSTSLEKLIVCLWRKKAECEGEDDMMKMCELVDVEVIEIEEIFPGEKQ